MKSAPGRKSGVSWRRISFVLFALRLNYFVFSPDHRPLRFAWPITAIFQKEMRLLRYSPGAAELYRASPEEARFFQLQRSVVKPESGCFPPDTDQAQTIMRQVAEQRTRRIDGQIDLAFRRELQWLRIDLLKIWAAPRFDVDAYARVRYQIRLVIDIARKAGDRSSSVVLTSPKRSKWPQPRRGAALTSSSIAVPADRHRASATPMTLMQDRASRDSTAAPCAKMRKRTDAIAVQR